MGQEGALIVCRVPSRGRQGGAAQLHATHCKCLPWRRAAVGMGKGEKERHASVSGRVCSGQCEATQLHTMHSRCLPWHRAAVRACLPRGTQARQRLRAQHGVCGKPSTTRHDARETLLGRCPPSCIHMLLHVQLCSRSDGRMHFLPRVMHSKTCPAARHSCGTPCGTAA